MAGLAGNPAGVLIQTATRSVAEVPVGLFMTAFTGETFIHVIGSEIKTAALHSMSACIMTV
jgi:hypothetical protein